ncbi:PDR/VanB family oxidoreductase [Burkholderia cepacia]|uniref:PDR/VanB family oxidoreductase n=1 Tax=Burkholderia cepacia TaxID=292 RepID=UPI00298F8CAF|nr:PDR/VanB family oxidoreductase [Burkholderia cepacia]
MTSNQWLSVRVARKSAETADIVTLELVDPDGGMLPEFSAGAHIDMELPGGYIRQYSLCNSPQERHRYLIGVLNDRAGRGGSRSVHENVRETDIVRIGVPRNFFALADDAFRSLLLAGGIGVTPILSMAEELSRRGANFAMHYCTRSVEKTAFLDRIRSSAYAERVQIHLDDGGLEQRLDMDALLSQPDDGTHLYVCGPTGFLDTVLQIAKTSGWKDCHIHFERFAAASADVVSETPFDVVIASSGQTVRVPAGRSVVDALGDAGFVIPVACQQGACGTCLTRVLDGEPDHRDVFMTPEEHAMNDRFTPCCSRSKTDLLVLDL